jgi:glycosyltransferase involved in cell wall biosynthesis
MSSSQVYKLAIVATHPIQYQAPWFRAMAADPRFDLHVFYGHNASAEDQAKAGFGVGFQWDLPLLEGYPHSFLRNVAKNPSVATFGGIDTPEVAVHIARGAYDAVLVSGWQHKSFWQAMTACWRSRTKLMVRGDSHLHTPRAEFKRRVKTIPYRLFISRLDACLAAGSWSREYFLHYGASPDRVFIVPHVVDENWLCAEATRLEPRRLDLRRRWELRDTSTVFGLVSKMIPVKRVADFIDAIGRLAQQNGNVQGLIVGDGPLRADYEALVNAQHVPVKFTGFLNQSEIAQAYASMDALVLPSASETWGMVVNEAMLFGRPCLVSDQVGCGPDLIDPDVTGRVFPMGDVRALCNDMFALARDQEQLRTMGKACRVLMRKWSVLSAVDAMIAAVEAVQDRR